jgi:hypothetical protein
MRFRYLLPITFITAAFAQQPATQDHDMSRMQQAHAHDGFMQGGMHHTTAKGVTLDVKTDANTHTISLRIGPMNLPANTSHMKMPQPADLVWSIPLTGWLLAYHPKLVDAAGTSVPGTVLHHVAFWNENRSDFLCPNKEEHIFGAGGELTDWVLIPGFGYRVEKGDQIRIETMIHNPTSIAYDKAYLEVTIPYLDDAFPAPVKNVYPTWIDVNRCANSSYDLPPGPSKKVASVPVKYSGILLGVGGHMHDYGQQLTLEVSSSKDFSLGTSNSENSKPQISKAEVLNGDVAGASKSTVAKPRVRGAGASDGNGRSAETVEVEVKKAQVDKAEIQNTGPSKTAAANAEKPKVEATKNEVAKTEGLKATKPVAVLPAKTDAQGHLLGIPVVTFFQTGGYPIAAGDKLIVTSAYNNPTGKLLHDGAMGIVVGYFVPQDPAALNSLRHRAKPASHEMSPMPHDH